MRMFGVSSKGSEAADQAAGQAVVTPVRRLVYGDLPAVLSIERRSFQTPWSLAMFVLELSKPSGICLCIEDGSGLSGYLVCSRYADVWHLMNIAVDPSHRRRGIATELMERLFAEAGPACAASSTATFRLCSQSSVAASKRRGRSRCSCSSSRSRPGSASA